jgi:TRAP-type C4-dicarboxylate transport system permease small subunit
MDGRNIRSFFWWIYYSLFLGLCIFIFVTAVKYVKGLLIAENVNLGKSLYGVAVAIMIFGLLFTVIAYLIKTLWFKITGIKGKI